MTSAGPECGWSIHGKKGRYRPVAWSAVAQPQVLDEAGDAGTADFLTDLLQAHEETAWMLRSFLD